MKRIEGDHAIRVENVTKCYEIGKAASRTLRETLADGARDLVRLARNPSTRRRRGTFWALNGVSFDIGHGEIVGVIGNNGAGKSTLLKILSRITEPTDGTVRYRGRVGSLLEVGTGFHPELSGRDNIFLNGAILGMSHQEIARHFDEIVAFAETERFIDMPVKRYSSGMYLRLAFAVAAHLDTEILLVDEVLAVGDVAFQKKCLARMGEVADSGRTVLFVSHNLTAVQTLCARAIWLREGTVAADGPARDVLSRYLRANAGLGSSTNREWQIGEGPSGENVELVRAAVYSADADGGDQIDVDSGFHLDFSLLVKAESPVIAVSLRLVDEQGLLIFDTGPPWTPEPWPEGLHRLCCEVPGNLLNDGTYRIGLTIRKGSEILLQLPEVLTVDVLDSHVNRRGWYGKWPGVLRPKFSWSKEPGDVQERNAPALAPHVIPRSR